ncbi:hypothetical protein F7725_021973 [Dissostichus mawsoni]|uniref:Uncharacterized protein n=1 Tax=Dissostichus mawsoni TaxID=36200 RepID=A0A7J5ZCM9_DISMA|nr:hypothetical protein F7725_021973 [Dissostichus mawsoni]
MWPAPPQPLGLQRQQQRYSPDRAKSLPFPSQQGKRYEETYSPSKISDKIPGLSREGSPVSAISIKEDNHAPEGDKEEPLVTPVVEEYQKLLPDNFQERRARAISAKAQEIEKIEEL